MYGLNKIKTEDIHIGNYAYSDYTDHWYIVSALPNFIREGVDSYALVRIDGHGYCYKSDSLDELKKKIYQDGGETTVYKDLIIEVKG